MHLPRVAILVCATFITLSATPMSAQPSSGSIAGVVRSAGGDPVPGVTITVTNQQTGATRVVVSATNGSYEVTALAPGAYTVAADIPKVIRSAHPFSPS